ncbi:MAG: TonB-dependent receptor [Bacteroidota bacterium]|nr:TonB-dependent receptor [Bacteroidota bacterium]
MIKIFYVKILQAKKNFGALVLILIYLGMGSINAQNLHLQVKILDSLSMEPLYGASVSMQKHRHLHISNQDGIVIFDSVENGQWVLHVSYIGYHHQDVMVNMFLNRSITILLCSESFHLHESIVLEKAVEKDASMRKKDILDPNQIAKKQGQNIADLLANINGVTTLSSAGGIAKPVIRGMHSQRLVTMQGDNRLEGQQWGEDHGPEIDPFSANRIEVIKGAASVEYGTDAIGGVIKILPRPWLDQPGIKRLLQTGVFSNNKQGAVSLLLEGRKGKETFVVWRTQGSLRKAGDSHSAQYNLSNTGFAENAQSAAIGFGYKKIFLETNLSRYKTTLGILSASHLGNLDDLKAALKANKPLVILPFTYQIGKPYQEVEHILFSVKGTYRFNKSNSISLSFAQQVNRRKEYDADRVYNLALQGKPAMDFEIQSVNGNLVYETRWAHHWHIKAGTHMMWQYNTVAGLQFIIPPFKSLTNGLFAVIRKDLYEGNIAFGLRYDMRWLDVPTYTRVYKQYTYQRFFNSPTLVINYNKLLIQKLFFTATLSSAWRPPTVNELYSYGLHYGIASFEKGDSLLKPERSYLAEISFQRQHKNWFTELTFFTQFYENYIYKKPLADPTLTIRGAFPTFQFTQDNVQLLGSELTLNYKPATKIYGGMMLSYLHAQNTGTDQPLLFMPANRLQTQLGYLFKNKTKLKGLYLELQFIAVARQNRFTPGADYQDPPAGYNLLHVNGGFSFKPFAKGNAWQVNMSFQNVLNTSYRDYMSRFRYFADETGFNAIGRMQIPF